MTKARTMARAGRRVVVSVFVAVCLGWLVAPATRVEAQGRRSLPREGMPDDDGDVSPAELQRLFDAYALMQAQAALQLSDEQYPRFLSRLRALQDVRRRAQSDRVRMLQQLRRLVQDRQGEAGDDRLREQMRALRELTERSAAEIVRAVEEVDEVLEPVQQARLRLFDEQMERRKLDLLMRARRGQRR